jgi:CBS domain-containing protein
LKGNHRNTTVREIASSPPITVDPASTMRDCMTIMTKTVSATCRLTMMLLGVISIGDVVNTIISEQASTIEELENISPVRIPIAGSSVGMTPIVARKGFLS